MEYKPYLSNSILVSRLGFGGWPLGNLYHGVQMTKDEGIDLIQEALQHGINFFDTAPNYALGKSEEILGMALKNVRNQVVINSKFGHKEDDSFDFSENAIKPSIIRSLKRLQTNYIDSILLHNPSFEILEGKTNHFNVLESIKREGLIKGYGVSIDTKEELEATLKLKHIDVIELLYNVFFQSTRDMLNQIKEKKIALIIKVPLDSGWLTGSYHKDTVFSGIKERWTKEDKNRRADLVEKLKKIIDNRPLNDYAMSFLLSYDAVTTVIPGIRTKSQLYDHLNAYKFKMDKNLKLKFEDFYDTHIKDHPLPW